MMPTSVAASIATSVVVTAITTWPTPIQLWPNAAIFVGTCVAGLVGGLTDPQTPGRQQLVLGVICGAISTVSAMILLIILNGNPLDPRFIVSWIASIVIGAGLYVGAAYLVTRIRGAVEN